LNSLIADDFTIKIILPDGATNVRLKIDGAFYDMSSVKVTTSEGYLDFDGRPTYTIENYSGLIQNKNI